MSMPRPDLDEALAMIAEWTAKGEAKSVGLLGNAADVFPELVRRMRGMRPISSPTRPRPMIRCTAICRKAGRCRMAGEAGNRPEGGRKGRSRLDGGPCRGDGRFLECGRADARLWQQHPAGRQGRRGRERLRFPRLRAGLYPPAVLPGIGPFRWVALSGDPEDIYKTDAKR
jgi:urocanate hydratase